MTKTFYCEFTENPSLQPLHLKDEVSIDSVSETDGYVTSGRMFKRICVQKCATKQSIMLG